MKYRIFGRTNLNISEIGFGAWAIGGDRWGDQKDEDSIAALNRAIDLGLNFIDTAAGYGDGRSERLIARVVGGRKERIVVATKTPPKPGPWPPSPYCLAGERYPEAYLRENVEERLRCLNADCLDTLMLHTWTRAWNRDPQPFAVLRQLQREGKIRAIGVSTPEHDQNSVIDLMRGGWVDVVEVIYSIFEQEPAAELLPVAAQCNVGIIVRCAFDEGALTGKLTKDTKFPPNDHRSGYFSGERLTRTLERVEKVRESLKDSGYTMAQAALKYTLAHPAVSVVIPGIRSIAQADANTAVSDLPEMPEELLAKLRAHNWRRGL